MTVRVQVKREVIEWALARAGMDIAHFPEVLAWMSGEKQPTVRQLEHFARKVHVPFGYLLLDAPPESMAPPLPFFRTGKANPDPWISPNVYDSIMMIKRRQEWLREYLVEIGSSPLEFVGKYDTTADPKRIAHDMRTTFQLDMEWARHFNNWNQALNGLVKIAENHGIVVVFNGVVGNNPHRPIPVEECRGFVLVDAMVPFLFINNNDFLSAKMFTLAHELAHIWLGHSAGFDFRQLQPADNPIEKLCDRVAAEFLVPEESFTKVWNLNRSNPEIIEKLARHFKVGPIVIARRALDTGLWTREQFFDFYESYKRDHRRIKARESSGGDFYATAKKRISEYFARYIRQAVDAGDLLYRDAYRLTGLNRKTFDKFYEYLMH